MSSPATALNVTTTTTSHYYDDNETPNIVNTSHSEEVVDNDDPVTYTQNEILAPIFLFGICLLSILVLLTTMIVIVRCCGARASKSPEASRYDLDGKTVLITDGDSPLGIALVEELCVTGARIILACKDIGKGQDLALQVKEETNCEVIIEFCDQSDMKSIRNFCSKILEQESSIDILINNTHVQWIRSLESFLPPSVGFSATRRDRRTSERKSLAGPDLRGILDAHWIINYLSAFVFTQLLMPLLKKGGEKNAATSVGGEETVATGPSQNTINDYDVRGRGSDSGPCSNVMEMNSALLDNFHKKSNEDVGQRMQCYSDQSMTNARIICLTSSWWEDSKNEHFLIETSEQQQTTEQFSQSASTNNIFASYANSMRANALFIQELAVRCDGTHVHSYCVDPGPTLSGLFPTSLILRPDTSSSLRAFFSTFFKFFCCFAPFLQRSSTAIQSVVYCACDTSRLNRQSGLLYGNCRVQTSPLATDEECKRLWEMSQRQVLLSS